MTKSKTLAAVLVGSLLAAACSSEQTVSVVLNTSMGEIEVVVYPDRAPQSAGSFLQFVDQGRYNGQGFYRVVRPDNDNGDPVISVIQGGVLDTTTLSAADMVPHEPTDRTGLTHQDGTLSLARSEPGTGGGGTFFICIDAQPSLDFGGARNADAQGFAAFGQVTRGMDVVRQINGLVADGLADSDYVRNQILKQPVIIERAYRSVD
ncbi:MAG: peptidylprolyl isomerase [Pseudomonadota bacterium]